MFKSGKKILKRLLCITLSAGMLVTQPAFAFGEEGETAAESPTPTPDPHTTGSPGGSPFCSDDGRVHRCHPLFQKSGRENVPSQHYQDPDSTSWL